MKLKGIPPIPSDVRELPSYGFSEAAHYLRIPTSTLRAWALGQDYRAGEKVGFFKPVIGLPDRSLRLLSFLNLVEAHVLDAIRRDHHIPLPKVRTALGYLKMAFPSEHPLADHTFETDGLDLFVEKYGQLINISQAGQLAIRQFLEAHLRRIVRDATGLPLRLYPFTRRRQAREWMDEPLSVVIDPYISFGRPVLAGTGIPTAIIAERYKAGESIEDLADDYGRSSSEIQEAIRCELTIKAA